MQNAPSLSIVTETGILSGSLATLLVSLFLLLSASMVYAQEPDSAAIEAIESPLERARLLLRARTYDRALAAAIEAGEQFGLPPISIGPHADFPPVSNRISDAFLYRGTALEMLRRFPEARADYESFMDIEPTGGRADELNVRTRYVNVQALRTLGRRIRDGEEIYPSGSRFDVGVFPLYNASDILLMDQVGFALTGVLLNGLRVLDHYVDIPLEPVPPVDLRSLLDEVLPGEVHAGASPIPSTQLSRALGAQLVVTGTVNEILGTLSAVIEIGSATADSAVAVTGIQSSYSPAGLQRLQRELVFLVADELERLLGFVYVPDKTSFADSVEAYILGEVDSFLEYGFATEQLLLGDLEDAEELLASSAGQAAIDDLAALPTLSGADSPPVDNLLRLTGESVVDTVEVPVVLVDTDSPDGETRATEPARLPAPGRSARALAATELQTATFLSALASRSFGVTGVHSWETGVDAFNLLSGLNHDPRDGKSATLDPTRIQSEHSILVIVPVPVLPDAAGSR